MYEQACSTRLTSLTQPDMQARKGRLGGMTLSFKEKTSLAAPSQYIQLNDCAFAFTTVKLAQCLCRLGKADNYEGAEYATARQTNADQAGVDLQGEC